MVSVKILETGEVKQVDRNVAHDLIDRGIAELFLKDAEAPKKKKESFEYSTRQIHAKHKK